MSLIHLYNYEYLRRCFAFSKLYASLCSSWALFENIYIYYYAGSISRPLGTNCEFHLVDERIVGRKPKSLSFEEAAAMPLTTITAWEALYDRLSLYPDTIYEKIVATSPSQPTAIMPSDAATNNNNKTQHHPHLPHVLIIGGEGYDSTTSLAQYSSRPY